MGNVGNFAKNCQKGDTDSKKVAGTTLAGQNVRERRALSAVSAAAVILSENSFLVGTLLISAFGAG